jgi:hypothetical protein
MSQKYTIIWEKWKDPLGYDDQEEETSELIDNSDDDDDDDDANIPSIEHKNKKIKCHIVSTPFGIIPFNENTASSEIFNFWTGHSNFAITLDVANIIDNIDGVETLNIFTKYRFRIAVGKAFIDSDVMRDINKYVYSYLESQYD